MGFSATDSRKKRPISRKNSGQILLESDRLCADFTNVFNEIKCLFVGGGGGGGGVMRVSLYNKKKHRLLIRNIDNLSLGLRSRLDLVLSCTRFFFHHLFF